MAWKASGFMKSCQSSGCATTKTLSVGVGVGDGAAAAQLEDPSALKLPLSHFDVKTSWRYPVWRGDTMEAAAKRATIYFEPELHKAIRLKAADTHRTVSDIVNEAVRAALREDQEDLAAFEDRVAEPTISYEALLKDLKANGKI
jgi:hypothetical protein